MSLFTRIYSFFSANSTNEKTGTQLSMPSTLAHEETPLVGPDGALQISAVWSCVTLLVETISSLPVFVYETEGDERKKAPKTLRIQNILHTSPNRRQTKQEFWEQMLLNYFLRGNMYARIVRDDKGEILSLWPMSADQVEVVQSQESVLFYKHHIDRQVFIYEERDILHIRGMGNGLIGLSPLDYMRSSLGLAVSAQDHTTKTYKKRSRRPGILMSDVVLTDEQRKALKLNFGDIVNGTDKELYVLEAQFKFEPLGMTPADLELLNTRKFAIQDLARWFGVPSVLINDTGETTALGSSITQIIEAFFKLKLSPQLSRIESAVEKRVFSARQRSNGFIVRFSFDALLRANLLDRMEIYSKAVQNGLKTRNECRKLENDPPLEGGDELTVQVNLIPIEKLGETNIQSGSVPAETIQQRGVK